MDKLAEMVKTLVTDDERVNDWLQSELVVFCEGLGFGPLDDGLTELQQELCQQFNVTCLQKLMAATICVL